ncbi:MAG TPA: hypothetical protein VK786_03505 [bacterium]|jgi:hypothetical protein|nr:hypothetical protein [bacterium]
MANATMGDLDAALDKGLLKDIRRLMLILAGAPLIYCLMGYWAFRNQAATAGAQGPAPIFLYCLGAVAIAEIVLSKILPERKLRAENLNQYFENGFQKNKIPFTKDRALIVSYLIRPYFLLKTALIEAVAVYGFMVFFMALGVLPSQPYYWLALAVCPVVSLWIFASIPTEADLRRLFENHLLR